MENWRENDCFGLNRRFFLLMSLVAIMEHRRWREMWMGRRLVQPSTWRAMKRRRETKKAPRLGGENRNETRRFRELKKNVTQGSYVSSKTIHKTRGGAHGDPPPSSSATRGAGAWQMARGDSIMWCWSLRLSANVVSRARLKMKGYYYWAQILLGPYHLKAQVKYVNLRKSWRE